MKDFPRILKSCLTEVNEIFVLSMISCIVRTGIKKNPEGGGCSVPWGEKSFVI